MKIFPHDDRYRVLIQLLRTLRNEASLYQSHVAEKLNKPQSFVSKYEIGERKLDPVELYLICDILGVTFADFALRYDEELKKHGLSATH